MVDKKTDNILTLKDLGLEITDNPDFEMPNISDMINETIEITTIRFNADTKFPYFVINEKWKGSNEVIFKQLEDINKIKGSKAIIKVKIVKPIGKRYLILE